MNLDKQLESRQYQIELVFPIQISIAFNHTYMYNYYIHNLMHN